MKYLFGNQKHVLKIIDKPSKTTYAHMDFAVVPASNHWEIVLSSDCAQGLVWSLSVGVHFEIGVTGALAGYSGETISF